MLFEEWEKGTGLGDYDEYKDAERLYDAMDEGFRKEDLFKLRKAMRKEHFLNLCDLASDGRFIEQLHRTERLTSKEIFVDRMITTLRDECNIDVLKVYITYMAEKAKAEEAERIQGLWDDLKGEKPLS